MLIKKWLCFDIPIKLLNNGTYGMLDRGNDKKNRVSYLYKN